MELNTTINIGDIITIALIVIGGLVAYFKGLVGLKETDAAHEVRITAAERELHRHGQDIGELFRVKADKAQ